MTKLLFLTVYFRWNSLSLARLYKLAVCREHDIRQHVKRLFFCGDRLGHRNSDPAEKYKDWLRQTGLQRRRFGVTYLPSTVDKRQLSGYYDRYNEYFGDWLKRERDIFAEILVNFHNLTDFLCDMGDERIWPHSRRAGHVLNASWPRPRWVQGETLIRSYGLWHQFTPVKHMIRAWAELSRPLVSVTMANLDGYLFLEHRWGLSLERFDALVACQTLKLDFKTSRWSTDGAAQNLGLCLSRIPNLRTLYLDLRDLDWLQLQHFEDHPDFSTVIIDSQQWRKLDHLLMRGFKLVGPELKHFLEAHMSTLRTLVLGSVVFEGSQGVQIPPRHRAKLEAEVSQSTNAVTKIEYWNDRTQV